VETGGFPTAGLQPIAINAMQRTNDRALESILAGDLRAAARGHAANIRILEGWARALDGSGAGLPADVVADLEARVAAMLADMRKAEVSLIPSA